MNQALNASFSVDLFLTAEMVPMMIWCGWYLWGAVHIYLSVILVFHFPDNARATLKKKSLVIECQYKIIYRHILNPLKWDTC